MRFSFFSSARMRFRLPKKSLSTIASWVLIAPLLSLVAVATTATSASAAVDTYSFTNAGATGNTGPTQVQVNNAYSGTPLSGKVTITTQGIQEWTVPVSGEYELTYAGASGGYTPSALGGKGRIITTRVNLIAGHVLKILVGQEGGRMYFSTGYAAGGGGGTYIYNSSTSSWVGVAGGGGGAAQGNSTYNATLAGADAAAYNSTSGTAGISYSGSWQGGQAGGSNGSAGSASSGGASGAGVNGDGVAGSYGGTGGARFSTTGLGGVNRSQYGATATTNVEGGFGGGAGAGIHPSYEADSGGGGGYSGGGGSATRVGAGGGGGNYYSGTYVSNALNTGHGYVTIKSSWTLVYQTTNPVRSGNAIVYSSGYGKGATDVAAILTNAGTSFNRVRYRMEINYGGVLKYADVSFDKWSGATISSLAVPDLSDTRTIKQNVSNLTIDSNWSAVGGFPLVSQLELVKPVELNCGLGITEQASLE